MYSEDPHEDEPPGYETAVSAAPIAMDKVPYVPPAKPFNPDYIPPNNPVEPGILISSVEGAPPSEQKSSQKYELSDAQIKGAKCFRIYAVLLIITSILGSFTPFWLFTGPIDMIIAITAGSVALSNTNPQSIERIPSQNEKTCCGFHHVYGLSIAAAVLLSIAGLVRTILFVTVSVHTFPAMVEVDFLWYFFGLFPLINMILAVTCASFMAGYTVPNSQLITLVDANQVLRKPAESTRQVDGCCDCCAGCCLGCDDEGCRGDCDDDCNQCCTECCNDDYCDAKCSRIACWMITLIFILVAIVIFASVNELQKEKDYWTYYDEHCGNIYDERSGGVYNIKYDNYVNYRYDYEGKAYNHQYGCYNG